MKLADQTSNILISLTHAELQVGIHQLLSTQTDALT